MTQFWSSVLYFVFGGVVGGALGFYFTKRYFEKQLKENPPINEKMIKIMMQQMGRTPSQKQINQMMKAMNKVQ